MFFMIFFFLLDGYLVFGLMTSRVAYSLVNNHILVGSCLFNGSSNVELHILIVSPKHAFPILFIFVKEMSKGEIIEDISCHNLRQK